MASVSEVFLALLIQVQSFGQATNNDAVTSHDVIVVGAGAAGLYAAKTLQGFGYEVLIIEAADRIGGRIKSETLGDMRVELGAEEHYLAQGDNPIWDAMIAEFGNDIYVQPHQGASAFSMDNGAGTCWTETFALNPCANDSDVVTVDDFWDWYQLLEAHQDPNSTLADDVLSEYGVGASHRAYHLYDSGIAGATFATNLDQLGARSLALESNEWTLSDTVRAIADKDLGYSDALERLWWDEVVSANDILLNTPVEVIDTTGDQVLVVDANGGRHLARQVIVTVSIGVLQSGAIEFKPELPASTVNAYMGIGFDSGMKVAVRFSSPWWETEGEPLAWLVTEGVAGVCWVPSDYKKNSASHILMCYPMGDNSRALRALADNGSSSAIVEAVLSDLDNTFPQAPNAASANYIDALVEDWGADPFTRGAYSYPKTETVLSIEVDNKRRDLKIPVAGDRIFFAGEATHETHPATVVGAIHEGERAALEVHSVNGSPGKPPESRRSNHGQNRIAICKDGDRCPR
jgi:monoamine oxidase